MNCPGLHCEGCGKGGPAGLVIFAAAVSGAVSLVMECIWFLAAGTCAALVLLGVPLSVKTYRAVRHPEPTWNPEYARVRPRANYPVLEPSAVYRQLPGTGRQALGRVGAHADETGQRGNGA